MESRRTGLFDVPEIPLLCVGLHHESEQMHPVSPQGCSGGIYDASPPPKLAGVINAATTSFEEDLLLVSKTIMKHLPWKMKNMQFRYTTKPWLARPHMSHQCAVPLPSELSFDRFSRAGKLPIRLMLGSPSTAHISVCCWSACLLF